MPDTTIALGSALQDHYRLEREIGHGGMATVYLAQDLRHDRKVALKVLSPDVAASVGTERFLREVRLAASLHHPHILPVYDSGEVGTSAGDARPFYVMPYVEGETLRDRITQERQLPIDEVVRIASEVADALDYAHSHGVVHRDIKPENILLEGGHALVADFGIARLIDRGNGESTLTSAGVAIGTPSYMSPEQATADRDLDTRSDVYSLGCVVYEMLAGQPPFTGPTVQVVTRQHITAPPAPITQYRPTVPPAVEAALARALAKAPADRFRTTGELADALRQAFGTSGFVPAAFTRPAQPRRLTRASRYAVWAVLIVAVVSGAQWARSRLRSGPRPSEAGFDPRRLAVLYFEDRSRDHGTEYLADGITESLIRELSDVQGLQVISANGVAALRGKHPPLDSITRALRVGTIVSGEMRSTGERLGLTVSMTDANGATEVGHGSFEVARSNALAMQDSLAKQVSFFLRRRLGEQVVEIQSREGTSSSAAWERVQRGDRARRDMNALVEGGDTAGAARRQATADSLYVEAASIDPKWIVPELRRGWLAIDSRHISGLEKAAAAAWITGALAHASRALALDSSNPEALHLRGASRYFQYLLNLDAYPMTSAQVLTEAERDLRAGTASGNPRSAQAWSLLSHLLSRRSKTAEARLAALRAYESDPYLSEAATIIFRLAATAIDLADRAEASRWCAEGFRRFPTDPAFSECQIELLALEARPEAIPRAWEAARRSVSLYPPSEREFRRRRSEVLVAMGIARAGLKDSARAVALRARTDDSSLDPSRDLVYLEVMLRNLLGDRDEALERLALYLATNPQDRANVAQDNSWWFAGLRDDPRFRELVRVR